MKNNVGVVDRGFRAMAGLGLLVCSVVAPLSLTVRLAGFAVTGAYLLFTALAGTCLGYTLMGRSTCRLPARR